MARKPCGPITAFRNTTARRSTRLLDIPHAELIVRKGFRHEVDSYSAFFENDHVTPTGLGGYLKERGFTRIFCVGLAFDYCVRYSAEDARNLGFDTDGDRGSLPRPSISTARPTPRAACSATSAASIDMSRDSAQPASV